MDVRTKVRKQAKETISRHRMIRRRDKVLVAVSGGKDSTVLLDILHREYPGQIEAITFNLHIPSYSRENLRNISSFCKEREITLHEVSIKDITGYDLKTLHRKVSATGKGPSYCTVCGILKRYFLNSWAFRLRATRVATGHNLDDMAQSILMNQLRGNITLSARLGPVAGVKDDDRFVPRIKPLYFVREEDIEEYSRKSGFSVVYSRCPFSKDAYRRQLRTVLKPYLVRNRMGRENLINGFIKVLPALQRKARGDIGSCSSCGQPAASGLCSACRLLAGLSNRFK